MKVPVNNFKLLKNAYNPKNVSMMEKRKKGLRSAGGIRSSTPQGSETQTLLGFNSSSAKLVTPSSIGVGPAGNRIIETTKLRG